MIKENLNHFAIVFFGGGFGACLRYFIGLISLSYSGKIWLGTLVANVLGCIIFYVLHNVGLQSKEMHSLIRVGTLGSLTTFSTFSYEVVTLVKAGRVAEALTVFALNIVLGLVLGFLIIR